MRKAIVTLAIGPRYRQIWSRIAQPNWSRYAARHGYDLICFEEPLDASERARDRFPAWQKLLVLGRPEVSAHDVVVWVDLDIVMNHQVAACIASSRSSDKVGLCLEEALLPELPLFELANQRIERYKAEFKQRRGLDPERKSYRGRGLPDPGVSLNTGVMVLGRREHRQLLEHVYNSYEKPKPGLGHEQLPLSYELARNNAYEILDPKFNLTVRKFAYAFSQAGTMPHPIISGRVALLCSLLAGSYFLHFAGAQSWMADLRFMNFDRVPVSLRMNRIAVALGQQFGPAAGANRSPAAEG